MLGVVIGDIAGSRSERRNHKSKDFQIFHNRSHPTDDTVMSLAIGKALLSTDGKKDGLSDAAIR